MLTGKEIIEHVQKILLDDEDQPAGAGVAWPEIETYFFARLRKLVSDKPDAHVEDAPFALAAGVQQQTDERTVVIMDVSRNTTSEGVPGRAIVPILMQNLDNSEPEWASKTGSAVLHFMHDAKDPRRFYVYPAVPDGWVMLKRSTLPEYDDVEDEMPISDEYEMALVDGTLAECYAKNAIRGDTAKSAYYEGLYAQRLGIKTSTQATHAGGVAKDAADQ